VVFENITMQIQDALAADGMLTPVMTTPPAVAFVDLVGFAALTERLGDHEAVRTVTRFEALAQDVIAASGGRIVKTLGDGLLLLFREPERAPGGCINLITRLARAGLPQVHVGLTAGPVIHRDGDIFGNCVNLAARLAGFAAPSQIMTDAGSLARFGAEAISWSPGGNVTPKGMAEIAVFTCSVARAL